MAAYQIPSDVIVEILVRLPVKALLRFTSVCIDWYILINNSVFIQLHHNKSLVSNFRHNHVLFYTLVDSFCVVDDIYRPSKPIKLYWPKNINSSNGEYLRNIVGSCNGLVCLRVIGRFRKVSCFLICNPSTHTFKFKLDFPFSELKCLGIWDLSYGFGYDGEHDDYKIVVTRKVWNESVRDVYIYSCKADSWKCATHTPAEGSSGSDVTLYNGVVFENNMLHYLVSPLVNFGESSNRNYKIARFDLSSETWRDDLSLPVAVKTSTNVEFGVLDRCLYLRLGEPYRSDHNIWMMKGYNRDEDLWIKTYNIPGKFRDYTLVAPSKDDGPPRLLFEHKYIKKGDDQLLWYDPYDETTEAFELETSSRDTLLRLCIASLIRIPGRSINFKDELDG